MFEARWIGQQWITQHLAVRVGSVFSPVMKVVDVETYQKVTHIMHPRGQEVDPFRLVCNVPLRVMCNLNMSCTTVPLRAPLRSHTLENTPTTPPRAPTCSFGCPTDRRTSPCREGALRVFSPDCVNTMIHINITRRHSFKTPDTTRSMYTVPTCHNI